MRKYVSGFTLMELIIVIVLLGILTAVAIPAYQSLISEGRQGVLNAGKGAIIDQARMINALAIASGKDLSYGGSGTPLASQQIIVPNASGTNVTVTLQYGWPVFSTSAPIDSFVQSTNLLPKDTTDGTSLCYAQDGESSCINENCIVSYSPPSAQGNLPIMTINSTGC